MDDDNDSITDDTKVSSRCSENNDNIGDVDDVNQNDDDANVSNMMLMKAAEEYYIGDDKKRKAIILILNI